MSEYQTSYNNPDVQLYQEPERTSILAIMSMVFGILGCCLVGLTSILAIPLSVFAMKNLFLLPLSLCMPLAS